ncbi:MAG: RsmB/NOP family class I SAM-dependent RNA methyltransferase [Myxococcota bacterium]|nr:RsmB/NOP family class I SAM-dependent RNA methyltransferase [Myxococcota bacterium]
MKDAIDHAAAILAEIEETNASADRTTKRYFRRHPELTNQERKSTATYVHGVRCHLTGIEYQLAQNEIRKSVKHKIVVYKLIVERAPFSEVLSFTEPSSRDAFHRFSTSWPEEPLERLQTQYSLPAIAAQSLLAQYEYEFCAQLAEALNTPGPVTIRARSHRISQENLASELQKVGCPTEKTRMAPHGLILQKRHDIRGCPLWKDGLYEVQDEGSQIIAQKVAPKPGESILDLCAGAGGKTLALADLAGEQANIVASDINPQRLADLKVRLKRTGLKRIKTVDLSSTNIEDTFDRVLVDAPCSSSGIWRRGPGRKWDLNQSNLRQWQTQQYSILREGHKKVRPGGTLVYATCSILAEENERIVEAFLSESSSIEIESTTTLHPHQHGTDGFFIAVMKRCSSRG